MQERDGFISYAREDEAWAERLARDLEKEKLRVSLDMWDIGSGDDILRTVNEGLESAPVGVLILSPSWKDEPRVQAEYEAIQQRAIERGQWLIPVLYKDGEVPPLLTRAHPIDFRGATGEDFEARLAELVEAIRGSFRVGAKPDHGATRHLDMARPPEPEADEGLCLNCWFPDQGRRGEDPRLRVGVAEAMSVDLGPARREGAAALVSALGDEALAAISRVPFVDVMVRSAQARISPARRRLTMDRAAGRSEVVDFEVTARRRGPVTLRVILLVQNEPVHREALTVEAVAEALEVAP